MESLFPGRCLGRFERTRLGRAARAFLTQRGHFQSIGYPLGLFAVFKPGRFADQSSFTVTKKACQNFEAGLLWTLAIRYFLVG